MSGQVPAVPRLGQVQTGTGESSYRPHSLGPVVACKRLLEGFLDQVGYHLCLMTHKPHRSRPEALEWVLIGRGLIVAQGVPLGSPDLIELAYYFFAVSSTCCGLNGLKSCIARLMAQPTFSSSRGSLAASDLVKYHTTL